MPGRSVLRASDADRERIAERLRAATAEGRLVAEELEERLGAVFSARTYGELDAVVADLPAERTQRSATTPLLVKGAFAVAVVMAALAVAAMVALVLVGLAGAWMAWVVIAWVFLGRSGRRHRHMGRGHSIGPGRGLRGGRARAPGSGAVSPYI